MNRFQTAGLSEAKIKGFVEVFEGRFAIFRIQLPLKSLLIMPAT